MGCGRIMLDCLRGRDDRWTTHHRLTLLAALFAALAAKPFMAAR
jgi:hypothetical protein